MIYFILTYFIIFLLVGLFNIFFIECFIFQETTINFHAYKIKSWIILLFFWPIFYGVLFYCMLKNFLGGENED